MRRDGSYIQQITLRQFEGGGVKGGLLDEQLLDLVLEREDLAFELRSLVGGDRARNHRAGHTASATKSNLSRHHVEYERHRASVTMGCGD